MGINLRKIVILSSIGLSSTAICASAATITPQPGTYAFSGPVMISGQSLTANCTLDLTGTVRNDGVGGVDLTIESGNASDGFACSYFNPKFDNGAWTGHISESDLPSDNTALVPVMFRNVQFSRFNRPCVDGGGALMTSFSNGSPASNPSYLSINDANFGECSFFGRVEAKDDVNLNR